MTAHTVFASLRAGGLHRHHAAFRLWEKAKRQGVWNPADIDLTRDAIDWAGLAPDEQFALTVLAAHFVAGEEAVTLDLLPLLRAVAERGQFEDELYLTSFLWEEAKHVDFFDRLLQEVFMPSESLAALHGPYYRHLFYETLPAAMNRLYADTSPEALAVATVTYNMVVEGVLAETGYHVWYSTLQANGLMPGTTEGIQQIQRDEARHIGFAVYLLSRLIAEHGDPLWYAVQEALGRLLEPALGVIEEIFQTIEARHGQVPFGLTRDQFATFALSQFQKRFSRLEKALDQPLDTIVYPPGPAAP